jgi:SAM-dependent methyltransferase
MAERQECGVRGGLIDVRRILSSPTIYEFFSRSLGGQQARSLLVREHVRPFQGMRVLDVGCGPGALVEHLGGVRYVGIDVSDAYIRHARRIFGDRAEFRVGDATALDADLRGFDVVLAFGVLHHLDDGSAGRLFEQARMALAADGRLITLDNAVIADQPRLIADRIVSWDRGVHIREPSEYERLAKAAFPIVRCTLYRDLLRIPYTHCVLECGAAAGSDAASATVPARAKKW